MTFVLSIRKIQLKFLGHNEERGETAFLTNIQSFTRIWAKTHIFSKYMFAYSSPFFFFLLYHSAFFFLLIYPSSTEILLVVDVAVVETFYHLMYSFSFLGYGIISQITNLILEISQLLHARVRSNIF